MNPAPAIRGWHSHVYYDAASLPAAEALIARARVELPVEVGRMHHRPVGPHLRWSCQLAYPPERFAAVIGWLALNRGDLTVFTHPQTGQPLADHRDRAIWMGELLPLELDALPATE
ncbi:MAG: DOPA 4,5-dioxygenase family protein [Lautropia sp.]